MESSMSSFTPENVIASQKAGVDTTFGLATQVVGGFEKLVDLNVRTVRTALDEHQALLAKTFSVRDPQEFFALQNQHLQNSAQRVQAYWTSVNEITTGVRGGYIEAAQDQIEKSQRNAQAFFESLVSNAPVGSEAVVTAWKTAIDAATQSANSAYEAAKKAAKQVVETAQNDATIANQTAVRAVSSKTASAKK